MKIQNIEGPCAQREKHLGLKTRVGAVLALVLAGLLLGAGPALAHDALEETNPKDGSTVATLPDEIELVFNNNPLALGSVVRVESPDGDVTEGKPKIVDETVSQAIAPGAPAGEYKVQWRVTSSDGHPISGEFSFTAEEGNTPAATESAQPSESAAAEPTATVTTDPNAGPTESVQDAINGADEDTGTSAVLIITLAVLALVVIGAVFYVFVLAPKRSSEN